MYQQLYLRRKQAADYIRDQWGMPCSTKWLAKLAVVGGGPVFRKAGRYPMYPPAGLDDWVEKRMGSPRTNTSGKAEAANETV